jgi:hypothetical protein
MVNTVSVRLGLAQEIIGLLRSYWNVADDNILKSLIQQAIDELKALDPDNLSVAP